MDRISIDDRAPPRENQYTPQVKNHNFRNNPPHIKQRDQTGPNQQVRPLFHEKYTNDEVEIVEYMNDKQINLMGVNDNNSTFLTQEE